MRESSDRNIGGVNNTQTQLFAPSSIREAMASHRGTDGGAQYGGQRWTSPAGQPAADSIRSHQKAEMLRVKFDTYQQPQNQSSIAQPSVAQFLAFRNKVKIFL